MRAWAMGAGGRSVSLRRYLWQLIGWCVLPPLLLATWFGVRDMRLQQVRDAETAEQLAGTAMQAVDRSLQARVDALSVLAGSPAADAEDAGRALYAQALPFRETFDSHVVWASPDGQMLFNTRLPFGSPLPPMPRVQGRSALSLVLQTGRPAVGDSFFGPVAGVRLVAVAVPVRRNGVIRSVLLITLEASRLEATLQRMTAPDGWSLALHDGRGDVIAERRRAAGPAPASSGSTVSRPAVGHRAVARSALSAWSVTLDVPQERHQQSLLAAAGVLAPTLLGALAAVLLGGTLASRRLSRAVASLADDAAEPQVAHIREIDSAHERLAQSARDRQVAMQALRDSEATFQAMFDGIADALVFADPQRRIRMVNPAFTTLFGYTAAEVVGRSTRFLYADPADYLRTGEERYGPQATPTQGLYEMRYRRKDGSELLAESGGVRVRGADGAILGLLGMHRDITARRSAEEQRERANLALSELHERFAAVFRHGPLAIAISRLEDGTLIDINPAAEAMFGHPREQALGRRGAELGLWADESMRETVFEALRRDGIARVPETTMRRRDGTLFDAAFDACRIEIAGVPHFVGMVSDITPQRRARRELEQHREQLQALVEQRTLDLKAAYRTLEDTARFNRTITDNIPGRVTYWDTGLRCRFVNQTYLDWVGLRADEVVGRTMQQTVDADFLMHALPHAQAALAGEVQQFERATRGRVHQIVYVPDRDESGAVRGLYAMAFDITALKQAEAGLREANAELAEARDRAEAASRAKSAFLANMSHEIRTPMNAIIGLAHLMRRDHPDARQRERLAKIDDAAKHLLQIINDILDLSKIESGKMQLADGEFALDELAERAFDLVRGQAAAKGIELVLDTGGLPERLRGDPTRLSQALINLLSNAVKFTERGWVRLRCELLARDGQRLQVRFEVQDTGCGIAPEHQAMLFEPFEQADNSATRRHGGTGLGLALTRHLARMMGGEAGLSSTPGAGSCFWITVALQCGSDAAEGSATRPLEGLRALLVDDLPEARSAVADRLTALGLTVDALGDGAAALHHADEERVAGRRYDVLLLDDQMPAPDGVQTLLALRALGGSDVPPAILLAASHEEAARERARDAHVDAVLAKPVSAAALRDTLLRMLRPHAAPAAPDAAAPGSALQRLREQHAGQRVLLAEDNPINREVAEELLRDARLVVETAADGRRAVDLALAGNHDLLLMDMQMPVLDGLDAARQIRARAGRGLAIVAMTANAFGEDRAACLAAGMDDHLAKPVEAERLYAMLLRWLPPRSPDARAGTP